MTARIPLPGLGRRAAEGEAPQHGPLIDTFGRVHTNLRISVTDRCNLRCTYCMPEEVAFLPREELLTFEEIEHFVRVAVSLGVTKVRLTGGEPLLRRDLPILIQKLASIPGLADLALTTNGLLLARQAESLHQAGLRRLNISLDTLDPTRFRALSRRDGLEQILEGLEVARRFPFHSIKINAVAIRGMIELDLASLAQYCRARGFEFRVIEFMPIGAEEWERNQFVAAAELLKQIEAEVAPLIPVPDQDPHAPAQDWLFADTRTRFGVIASVSQPFCRSCNRLRLTADGKFRNCLFAREETDLKWFLRQGPQADRELEQALRAALWQKWDGHDIHAAEFLKPDRTMHRIGG